MKLVEVKDAKSVKDFQALPFLIYKNDPNWIPHLKQEIEEVFDRNKNPYFKHGDCARWVLYNDKDQPIGCVAAFINEKVANTFEQPTGGMGFFECVDDQAAANKLFDTCKEWLAARGMKAMDGPINFGEKDRFWGLLIEGREKPAIYTMNHHPVYYTKLFENYGFTNYYEQIIYHRRMSDPPSSRLIALAERVMRDKNYRFEPIKKSQGDKYAEDFRTIYNKAWKAERTDFEELTQSRAKEIMHKLKPVLDEDICWFAYYNNEPIGVFIAIPELNEIFKYVHGNFNLLGKLKFLWYQNTKGCRTMMGFVFGIVPEFQGKGIEAAIFNELGKVIQPKNRYDNILINWIGSFNKKMIHLMVALLGVDQYKKYVTYRKIF